MSADHEKTQSLISAAVAGWFEEAREEWGDDFRIGTHAVIFEVEFPPADKGRNPGRLLGWTCSDPRNWVQAGLFRRALLVSELDVAANEDD